MQLPQDLIKEYEKIENKDTAIGRLVELYERISITLAYLRYELGENKDSHIQAYISRKRLRTEKMIEFAKKMAETGKFSMTKVEAKADWASIEELADELVKEAQVEKTHQTCLALEKILKAIELRVAYFKFEVKETKQNNITI